MKKTINLKTNETTIKAKKSDTICDFSKLNLSNNIVHNTRFYDSMNSITIKSPVDFNKYLLPLRKVSRKWVDDGKNDGEQVVGMDSNTNGMNSLAPRLKQNLTELRKSVGKTGTTLTVQSINEKYDAKIEYYNKLLAPPIKQPSIDSD